MRYAVLVFLDSNRKPKTIVNEVVSNLDFDNQEVTAAVVLNAKGKRLAVYDRKENT
jgi:hypothetical protein